MCNHLIHGAPLRCFQLCASVPPFGREPQTLCRNSVSSRFEAFLIIIKIGHPWGETGHVFEVFFGNFRQGFDHSAGVFAAVVGRLEISAGGHTFDSSQTKLTYADIRRNFFCTDPRNVRPNRQRGGRRLGLFVLGALGCTVHRHPP